MAHILLKQISICGINLFLTENEAGIVKIEVACITEVVGILESLSIEWITTNKIENSLWVRGTAFFDKRYCRVANYDEVHNVLSIHKN
jgi:hypothetical protein